MESPHADDVEQLKMPAGSKDGPRDQGTELFITVFLARSYLSQLTCHTCSVSLDRVYHFNTDAKDIVSHG